MNKKLRSQTGASLILALLLFLVCAVVGSVVLTAGTAAAGRLSEMSEMDQRYYAVTSAANLLGKELNNETVTIRRTREQTVTYSVDSDESTDGSYIYTTYNPDDLSTEIDLSNLSFLSEQTVSYLFNGKQKTDTKYCTSQDAWTASFYTDKTASSQDCTLTFDSVPEGIEKSSLAVNVIAEMDKSGTLTLKVSNAGGVPGSIYRLNVVLVPSVKETITTYTASPVMLGDGSYTVTTTDTKTAEVTWKLQGIEKVVS